MVTRNDSILEYAKSGRVWAHEGYVKAVDKISLLDAYEAASIDYDASAVSRNFARKAEELLRASAFLLFLNL